MKKLNIKLILALLMSMVGYAASAHDIEVQNAQGVTIYYNFINDGKELAVTSSSYYSNKYTGNVVIPEKVTYNSKTYTVTSIGSGAFYNCTGLTSVTIPNSVTSIESGAFTFCNGLKKVIITDIAAWCRINFTDSSNPLSNSHHLYCDENTEIKDLVIPNDVTSIGVHAFSGCYALSSVTIPNSVTSIGNSAFSGCYFENQNFINNSTLDASANNYWGANIVDKKENGCMITNGILIKYCGNENSVTIPNSVTSIGSYSFYNCHLTSVIIGNNVTSIGNYAFSDCSLLSSINIPDNVKNIGHNAFWECKNLSNVIIGNGVESIGIRAFADCENLTSVTIGNGVREIGAAAFKGCNSVQKVIINDIEAWCKISFGNDDSKSSNPLIFAKHIYLGNDEIVNLEIPNTISIIKNYAFYGCSGLKSVKIPNSVQSIGYHAFDGCSNIKELNIPNSVHQVGIWAFAHCTELVSIKLSSSLTQLPDYCFVNCPKVSELTIPNSVQFIGSSTFSSCTSLSTIYLGYSILDIKYSAFSGCSNLMDIYIKTNTPPNSYESSFVQYNASIHVPKNFIENFKNHPVWGKFSVIKEYQTSTFKIDKDIAEVDADYIVNNRFLISEVIIPNSVKKIKSNAFYNIPSLTGVIIESGSEELDFEEGGNFQGSPLNNVFIGRKMIYSQNSPFKNNKEGLKTLKFGEYVTNIKSNEFSGYKRLTSIEFHNGLKKIGSMAFYGCEGLTELTIPGSVTEIDRQAFDLCSNLKSLRLDDGKELLKFTAEPNNLNNAFQNSPLEEIYLGRNFIFTGNSPLAIFETLKSITIGEEVSDLAEKSFIGCPNLKDVTSYSKVVPTISDIIFTPSYQTTATLHVPYALYDEYKVANVWKDFGTIVNFEGLYNLVYNVDGEEYKKYVVEQGTTITPETAPYKEGYTFSGWSEIPATMPAHDVTVTGTFTLNTGIIQIMSNRNSGAMIFTIDGKRLSQPQRGLNIVRMSDGTTKKVVVK